MVIFWFRRDLRLDDNAGLYHALRENEEVLPVFIFDTNILDDLENRTDARVQFIHDTLEKMNRQLAVNGSSLHVFHGTPETVFSGIIKKYNPSKVYTNNDYETYARGRDDKVNKLLADAGISFHSYKDHVIFEKDEIVKDDGTPYVVYSPYSRKWISMMRESDIKPYPVEKFYSRFYKTQVQQVPSLESIGFSKSSIRVPSSEVPDSVFAHYGKERNFPGEEGTSRLGIHLRFGTISIRKLVSLVRNMSDAYLSELIWREFYQMILWNFPHIGRGEAFKKEYDRIAWRNNEHEFALWCDGKTGYPLVDAGMRQLNETGFMHNRVRMVTASFLSKHLLIDWRWGEAYFAQRLLDYDFASNNGGWQWAAGSGCDAAPYFRIFSPAAQAKKFDAGGKYIKRWVRDLDTFSYPSPVVDHEFARKRCLTEYTRALSK